MHQARWAGKITTLTLAGLLSACAGGLERGQVPSGESPADLYVDLATEYVKRGQLKTALGRAQRAIELDGRSARAHYILAIIHQRLGQRAPAAEHFARAVELAPENPDYRNAWGAVLCAQGRHEDGLREIRSAIDDPLHQGGEMALMNAADCSRRAGRMDDYERYLTRALERNPGFPPALLALARLSYERGDDRAARAYLGRYSRVGSPTPAALLLAARVERRLGNAEGAKMLERSLRQRFPDSPEVMQL